MTFFLPFLYVLVSKSELTVNYCSADEVYLFLIVLNRLPSILRIGVTKSYDSSMSNLSILLQRLTTSYFACVRTRCKCDLFPFSLTT